MLDETQANMPERTASELVRRKPRTQTWRYRSLSTVAGSWVCGAIVGAIATFLLVSRTTLDISPGGDPDQLTHKSSQPTTSDSAVVSVVQSPAAHRDDSTELSDDRIARQLDAHLLVSSMLFDPYGARDSRDWHHAFRLQAGMYLRGFSSTRSGVVDSTSVSTSRSWPDDLPSKLNAPRNAAENPLPRQAITREELLRELIGENPDLIL